MSLEVYQLLMLKDNYSYVLRDKDTNTVMVVDPSEAEPVVKFLDRKGWQLNAVLNTHHHHDHTGGNLRLQEMTECDVIGYKDDAARIPGITVMVEDNERLMLGNTVGKVIVIPGHTLGHVAYWFETDHALFCGDTLFTMGCGRVFEGSMEQMYSSLCRLAALPEETLVYCGHEYSHINGAFALTIEPNNLALKKRYDWCIKQHAALHPTVPSTMGLELKTNPFLRAGVKSVKENLGMGDRCDSEVFREIRERKNRF